MIKIQIPSLLLLFVAVSVEASRLRYVPQAARLPVYDKT